MKLIVSPEAFDDLQRLRAFLASESPNAAARTVRLLEAAIESLADLPQRGRPASPDIRELVVPFGRSAYILRYALISEAETVVVLRLWHSREDR